MAGVVQPLALLMHSGRRSTALEGVRPVALESRSTALGQITTPTARRRVSLVSAGRGQGGFEGPAPKLAARPWHFCRAVERARILSDNEGRVGRPRDRVAAFGCICVTT